MATEGKKKKPWVRDAAIYSALRRAYRSSPAVAQCLDEGKEEFFIPSKKGKPMRRVRFSCEKCDWKGPRAKKKTKKRPAAPGIAVDHVEPVIDPVDGNLLLDGTRNWIKQILRLFVDRKGLQRLCPTCHTAKSKAENARRREQRKAKANE
jgi:hypothetical protein